MDEKPKKRDLIFKYLLSMFMDHRHNGGEPHMSLGRVLLAALSGAALYVWLWKGGDIPGTYSTFLLAVAGYVLGSKAADTLKAVFSKPKQTLALGPKTPLTPPTSDE